LITAFFKPVPELEQEGVQSTNKSLSEVDESVVVLQEDDEYPATCSQPGVKDPIEEEPVKRAGNCLDSETQLFFSHDESVSASVSSIVGRFNDDLSTVCDAGSGLIWQRNFDERCQESLLDTKAYNNMNARSDVGEEAIATNNGERRLHFQSVVCLVH
jgi:hypothetical protein